MRGRVVALRRAPAGGGLVAAGPREIVAIEVAWDDGTTTFGEASPLAGFSRESAGDVASALEGAEIVADEAGFSVSRAPPSARFAFECAARAHAALLRGTSVAELLGGDRPVAYAAVIGAPDGSGAWVERGRALAAAHGVLKVKLGPGAIDHASLRALRGAGRLRFDANGRWSRDEAPARLAELAEYAPELVEQPCAPGALAGLDAPVPWAADESLAEPGEAEELLRDPGCHSFVLKPSLLGLERARDLGVRAHDAGKAVVVTHAFDGPVALAASRALARALPAVLACGLLAHEGLAASPLALAEGEELHRARWR